MIPQCELVVGVGIPGPVDLERAGGLARRCIAQVVGDAAVLVAELPDAVEGRIAAGDTRDVRIQPAAGDQEQREAGAGFLVVDANGSLLEKAHAVSPCPFCYAGGLTAPPAFQGSPLLSCVFVSKSLASCRSCNWLAGSPEMRLTMRPRFTAGRFAIASVQPRTFLHASPDRESPA